MTSKKEPNSQYWNWVPKYLKVILEKGKILKAPDPLEKLPDIDFEKGDHDSKTIVKNHQDHEKSGDQSW